MMKLGVVLVLVAVIVLYLSRSRMASAPPQMPAVHLGDVPRVLQSVVSAGRDGTFGVVLFGERGQPPAEVDALNVQFSVENGRVGLDWVLLAPLNIAARERVTAFFKKQGSPLAPRSMNNVDYLRTEKGDLATLCEAMLRSVFSVTETQRMDLIAEGFTWSSK